MTLARRIHRTVLIAAAVTCAYLALGAAPSSAQACDTTWIGGVSQAWEEPGNWSAGVPDALKTACVAPNTNETILVSGFDRVKSLALGGGAGSVTVSVQGHTDSLGGAQKATFDLGDDATIASNATIELVPGTGSNPGFSVIGAGNLPGHPAINEGTIRTGPAEPPRPSRRGGGMQGRPAKNAQLVR